MQGSSLLPHRAWCLFDVITFFSALPLYMTQGSTSNAGCEIKPAASRFRMDPYSSPIACIKTHDFINNNSTSNAGVGWLSTSNMINEAVVIIDRY